MSKKRKILSLIVLGVLLLASLALSLLCGRAGPKESLRTIMRDAVLHEDNKVSLFVRSIELETGEYEDIILNKYTAVEG